MFGYLGEGGTSESTWFAGAGKLGVRGSALPKSPPHRCRRSAKQILVFILLPWITVAAAVRVLILTHNMVTWRISEV